MIVTIKVTFEMNADVLRCTKLTCVETSAFVSKFQSKVSLIFAIKFEKTRTSDFLLLMGDFNSVVYN